MNIHSNKPSNKEVQDVSARVKNTKLEIQQLKHELQQLLNSGTQSALINNVEQDLAIPVPLTTPEKPRRDPQPTKHAPPVQKKSEPTRTSPPKKVKTYNVADAREYIKKQKEKRAEELRAQIHVTDNQVELKKEKLRELHQKALELVNKNVQLKRERSKSRDRGPPVRLDKSNARYKSQENVAGGRLNVPAKSAATRAKSQEAIKIQERPKSQERVSRTRTSGGGVTGLYRPAQKIDPNYLYPPKSKSVTSRDVGEFDKTRFPPSNKVEVAIDLNQGMLISSKPQEKLKSPSTLQTRTKSKEKLQGAKFQKPDERTSRTRTRGKRVETVVAPSTSTQNLIPYITFNSSNTDLTDFKETVFLPFQSPEVPLDLNERIPERDLAQSNKDDKTLHKNITQRPKKPKQVLELSVMTDACLKDTKETQTNRNFENVAWMQPPPALPYPYNFINTVKRKLQQAINSPRSCVDVGVQNSGDNSEETPNVGRTKSKEEIKEMLIKSTGGDLRSFASHKGPNLDLQVVENLELVPNGGGKIKSSKDGISRNLFTGYDSESDTSKNIPEISSESLASASSKPHLSLDKLKSLKLQKLSKSSHIDDNSGEKDSYSSDFQKESVSTKKSKSTSTIKTVVSENKASDVSASDISLGGNSFSGTATNYAESTHKTDKPESTKHSIQNFTNFINKCLRGDGNFPKSSNKSSSDSQPSKSTSSSKSQLVTESLVLKQPSVSLTIHNGQSSDRKRVLMNTITIRSGTEDLSFENLGNGDDSQGSFKSLLTKDRSSRSSAGSVPEILVEDTSTKSVVSNDKVSTSLNLKQPTMSLKVPRGQKRGDVVQSQMKNITIKSSSLPNNTVNELHLKFEAEVRLLNDFNESFKQLKAVEEAFENLKNKHETNLAMTKTLQNVDTQTSVVTKTSTNVSTERSPRGSKNSSINFSRGSEVAEELNDSIANNNRNTSKSLHNSSFSTDWNLSNLNASSVTNVSTDEGRSKLSISGLDNFDLKLSNCASILSLNIFDQLIKDEDTRIQQLKTIIKIREQALLDRTKSELVWLDIQKKQLIETGKIEEASLLKKKQRGIILKHEQERNEIKKLKQMQKEASEHRKNTLKQQRNLIKHQLCTDNMLSQITVKKRKERRSTGPLRVVQSCSESIHSETSISLKSSGLEDILSITSKSLRVSEESEYDLSKVLKEEEMPVSTAKRTLLMREAALQKRRKAAEELLRWHRKLLDEERKISELEAAATSVVRQEGPKDKYKFNGKQLNQLWRNMTGCDEKKFVEDKLYVMSQTTLERLCKSARQHSGRNKRPPKHERSNEMSGVSDANNYSSAFEPESVQEIISQEEKTKISSISELIDNFSRIEDEISTLSKKSEDIVSLKESSRVEEEIRFERDESEKTVPEESEASSKDVEDEETSVTEAVEESSIKLSPKDLVPKEEVEATPTPEQVSTKIEDLEEAKSIPEVSTTTEDQEEKLEEPSADKSVEEISTHKESEREIPSRPKDQDTIADQISKDTEETKHTQEIPSSLEKEDATNDDQLSINEDIEEPKSPEDQAIPSEHTSTKSLDLEEIQNLEELYPVHEVHLEEPSEHISTEDDKSTSGEEKSISKEEQPISEEKDAEVELSTKEEKLTSRISVEEVESDATPDEQTTVSTEEQPSTEGKAGFIEANFHEVETELSLEEALESAFKIEESLSKLNEKLISVKKDELSADSSSAKEVESVDETSNKTTSKSYTSSSVHTDVEEKTPDKKTNNQIDVKKRVSEILADASPTRGDKSPRLQDLYVTAYDVGATNSSEFTESYIDGRPLPPDIYGSEAEELRRKQLAIEQEIKQIELQQKEQLPYVFMREIPNKPPPPYTPPSSLSSISQTILPSEVKEINELACYSSKVLYKAYQNNNLDKVKFSENGFKLFSKVEVPKICAEYVFDICRDVARNHYKQFEKCEEPTWLATKKPQLTRNKPPDVTGLEKILNKKLKELFGFKKTQIAESAIIKWGRKKRDHVDEVLVIESQEEESQWTNFDKDELIVKNQVTDDIMKMLLEETAAVFAKIFSKKKVVGRACDKSE